MGKESTASVPLLQRVPLFPEHLLINRKVHHITGRLVEAGKKFLEHETFLRTVYRYIKDAHGVTTWELPQYEFPNNGHRPNFLWIYSSGNSVSAPNIRLSVITETLFPVQPEIRISFRPSDAEKKDPGYTVFGDDLAICIGLCSPDGSISADTGGHPKTPKEMLARAHLVADTFTTYLNSLLPKYPTT